MSTFGTHVMYREKGKAEIKRFTFTESEYGNHSQAANDFGTRLIQSGCIDFLEFHPFQLKDEARNEQKSAR